MTGFHNPRLTHIPIDKAEQRHTNYTVLHIHNIAGDTSGDLVHTSEQMPKWSFRHPKMTTSHVNEKNRIKATEIDFDTQIVSKNLLLYFLHGVTICVHVAMQPHNAACQILYITIIIQNIVHSHYCIEGICNL